MLGIAAALGPIGATAGRPVPCDSKAAGVNGPQQFTCVLDSAAAKTYRFTAHFSGGHDDTTASLAVTVNGLAAKCDEGSKTSLMGEDGEVSLVCRLSLVDNIGMRRVLGVVVTWNHAEYVSAELAAE